MIIELYGLSASGKTTFARKLENESDFQRVRINSNIELLWYNSLFFVKYPIKFIVLFYYVVVNSRNLKMFYYKFMNTILHHNAKYEKAKKFKNAIIDQGHFQNIISVFEDTIDSIKLNKYIHFLPKSDLLIFFQIDANIRKTRTNKRGYAARSSFGEEYVKQWEKNTQSNNDLFERTIRGSSISYIFLRLSSNTEDIFKRLIQRIAMKKHFDHLSEHITGLMNKSMLDLGSGRGKFILDVKKRGGDIVGLEKNIEYINKSMRSAKELGIQISVIQGEAENLPFQDSEFDFLNISEVIEHVEDPKKMLKESFRVLKPGGRAYLSVPNRFGIKDPHLHLYFVNWLPRFLCNFYISIFSKHKIYSKKAGRQNLREMHYYTFNEISNLIKNTGFKVIDIREIKLRKIFYNKVTFSFASIFYKIARNFFLDSFHLIIEKDGQK